MQDGGDGPQHNVSLVHRHVFGLTDLKANCHWVDDNQILYPAGHNAILYSTDTKTQKVFAGSENSMGISCLAVAPNRRYLCVAEKGEVATATIFDLHTGKKRKTLPGTETTTEFVSVAFSSESKFLLTQSGAPDWSLTYWSWEKARAVASIKSTNNQGSAIHECSFNPDDTSTVCVIGDGIFKFFRLQEGAFKPLPNTLAKQREAANQIYTCHCWLQDSKLIVCCESGEMLLFDSSGELKLTLPCSPQEHRSVLTIVAYNKGFVTGGEDGCIRVFEKTDDPKEAYRNVRTHRIDETAGVFVRSVCVSPRDEVLGITLSSCQLFQMSLSSSDLLKTEETPALDHILAAFHNGAILGLDVCVRKPLVVTCGVDKTVRVWNYVDKTCELSRSFTEEAFSVAFHPSGFHLIVGFSDKLRLMNLLMEELRTYKEIPIKACREVKFAHGGEYFAAVNSNAIQVYKTYTCEVVCNLRGHNTKVKALSWSQDDSILVSCGMDGAVNEYSIPEEGRRMSDCMHKGTTFTSIVIHTDVQMQSHNIMYVVGSDRMIKEVQGGNQAGEITNFIETDKTLGQLALAHSAKALFAGVAEPEEPGAIRAYTFPPQRDGVIETQTHAGPVTRMCVTLDDGMLFTAGEDGTLYIYEVRRKDKATRRDKEGALPFADEILVTKAFLEDKQAALLDFERQVEELENQIDFQLRHRESYHKEKMAELEEKYSQEIEQERTKYELLREEKNEMELEYIENMKDIEEAHHGQTQKLEASFQHKMSIEVQRYQKLSADLDRERQDWNAQHASLLEQHSKVLEARQQRFDEQRMRNNEERQKIMEEKQEAFKKHLEMLLQLEMDADREIEELKEMFEHQLAQEKDEKVRLRGQAGIHRKHHEDLKRQMTTKEKDLTDKMELNKRKQEKIDALLKDKESNEKEIRERDKTISDKEHRIFDLKKQNQELEKFKFVLDYKIKELKAQIDPKNDDIAEMRQQIKAMDFELEEYQRKNKQLALDISQHQMKQRALVEEIKSQKKKLFGDLMLIKRFKLDLDECIAFASEPKHLKEAVAALFRKYVQSTVRTLDLDTDSQKEYNRQRTYLEKSVDSLKRKLAKDSEVHRIDNMRIMQENVSLIREINDLRREINFLKHEQVSLQVSEKRAKAGSQLESQRGLLEKELAAQREELRQLQLQANPEAEDGGGD